MDRETYTFYTTADGVGYFFISEGSRGKILKGVSIKPLPNAAPDFLRPIYNLAFGDARKTTNGWTLDHSVRSGNGDMPRIIATVVQIAMEFMAQNTRATLSFQGYADIKSLALGKNQRTILYQRVIDSHWSELAVNCNFWGAKNNEVAEYTVGNQYERILARLK
ncbi:MAG: hypothetical protein BGO21_11855 [Dyadobacter sp. 50-39]|uniref:DUF6934 family protein n=1 Tax=Dyadobacter sp. 50-39 TaxID=1895756 RepID=UPI00096257AB|nr:hypothetical protein [Dyadobacter sp. 50-39]OJV20073.1 MAG: hypothetical protein BGO21_11855 [Dyadobacter sp. 50-39]